MHILILRLKLRLTVSFIFWPPDGENVAVTSLFKRVTSQLLIRKGAALRVGLVSLFGFFFAFKVPTLSVVHF